MHPLFCCPIPFSGTPSRTPLRMGIQPLLLLLVGLWSCACFPSPLKAPLRVAVSANFASTVKDIARQFEQESGIEVQLTTASSGKIFAQLIHGAPYDVFFSADEDKPQRLVQQQLARQESLYTYANGVLGFCLSEKRFQEAFPEHKEKQLEQQLNQQFVSHWLRKPGHKLAIANQRLAPYGKAAIETLERLGGFQGRLLVGENVNQSFQFVASGNADAGFVAWSMVISNKDKRLGSNQCWQVPDDLHQPIRQDVVILSRTPNRAAAEAFLAFVRSPAIQKVIASHGYRLASTENPQTTQSDQ